MERLPVKAFTSISSRKVVNGRPYSAFNILNGDTLNLFTALSDGAFLLRGFDNKKLRTRIFYDADSPSSINKTTRLLAKLRAHKIIKKVPRSNRYYLTNPGRSLISSVLLYTNKELLNVA